MTRERKRDLESLTELESCVLAIVAQLEPCTPYAVRRYLAESRSSFWSASAGAIYPLLRRLEQGDLLAVEESDFGSRRKRSYRLTPKGRRGLTTWLSAPVSESAAAHTHDPLRTRVFFLDELPTKQRRAFVEDAIAKSEHALRDQREELASLRPQPSVWEVHGREGAIAELKARIAWLRRILESLAAR